MQKTILIVLIFIVLIVGGIALQGSSGMWGGQVSRSLESFFASPARLFSGLFQTESSSQTIQQLTYENELLKARILFLAEGQFSANKINVREAHVFSTYPFNHRNSIGIDIGKVEGVTVGAGVAVDGVFLLGQVVATLPHTSTVQTIFDTEVSLPVKIGTHGVDALLVGGRIPRLTLIVRDAEVFPGDEVYSVGPYFPYGLKIGEVLHIKVNSGGALREATLRIPYEISDLEKVSVFLS